MEQVVASKDVETEKQLLELTDIQGTVLRNRPLPYVGVYLLFRIDDAPQARTLLKRMIPHITSAADWQNPADKTWINIVFTHQGLTKLGLPESILKGFPLEFRSRMKERKEYLGDVGESDPSNWDMPAGSENFDVALFVMAQDQAGLDEKVAIGHSSLQGLKGVVFTQRIDLGIPSNLREHFGYVDGISRPFIEGQGGSPLPGQGDPMKAGEFVLGYVNELGDMARGPGPEEFWRNGTYISIRKLHQKVALFRRFLIERGNTPEGQEVVAAKMVGRWRSGCPLALSPDKDNPELVKDPQRNNAFSYYEDDPRGLKTPVGCHIRRSNPRDALNDSIVDARLHRLLRRGSAYGPMLPEGTLDDDGVDRGVVLAFVNADPSRQFEFVQSQWINDGDFISAGSEKDPIVGSNDGNGSYTYSAKPVRKHMVGLPTFVVTKGGEHVFLPGIRGLKWLAEART
jgi:Dyp-type peroxidase family